MITKPYQLGKCLAHALLLWIVGFVWGMVVFLTPALKDIASVPYISKFPAVTIPLLIVYIFSVSFLAKRYLQKATDKTAEAWKYGITLLVVSFVLDLLVIVLAFKSYDYFSYLSIWLAYAVLVFVPVKAASSVQA
ncbi:MAG: hypothetical protein HYV34_02075 [Candidatus Kerfeldbacteria bacterium]|nr:hypothetical protein [Candidatus Kerfeldbacteria bacterium]